MEDKKIDRAVTRAVAQERKRIRAGLKELKAEYQEGSDAKLAREQAKVIAAVNRMQREFELPD